MATRSLLLGLMIGALVLTGCSEDSGGDPVAQEPVSTSTSTPRSPEPRAGAGEGREENQQSAGSVPETLDFSSTLVSGQAFEGASLAGRPTLLWFWAPWCPTCRGQIPQVEGLAADHADELNVVGVGSLDSSEAIADFAGDVDGVVHLEDVDGELWQRFGVTEQSSFVLLDAEGTVVFEAGYGGTDDLDARVDDVLG